MSKDFIADIVFVLSLCLLIFLYFPEVFFLKLSFLSGDHRAQHYPWAAFYAEQIRQFHLPWWTSYFHCGFPLLAEGQVGAFYPLNLLFYFSLPVYFAYSYGILAHYFLGAILFYGYSRSLRLSSWASFFGALIFLFGTAQGGYYYNLNSQKVLIWFPLALWLCDQIIEKHRKSCGLWLALVFAVQIFGGFLQYAVYSIGFTVFYFCWFSVRNALKNRKESSLFSNLAVLISSIILAAAIASPQLGSTWELAGFSRRFSYPLDFAFIGSMNPLAAATLLFPHWDGFLRSEIFIGAPGLFFLLLSLTSRKKNRELFFFVLCLAALALALGKLNPLYVLFVKLTGFSGFRIPSKFIYYALFSLCLMSAFGFQRWLHPKGENSGLKAASGLFVFISIVGAGGLVLSNWIMITFASPIKAYFRQYLEKHFSGSILHPKPMLTYFERLEETYANMLSAISFQDVWTLGFVVFILLTLLWIIRFARDQKRRSVSSILAIMILAYLNFYFYGFTSIKGNLEPYSFVEPRSQIAERLQGDKDSFRIHRFFESLYSSDEFFMIPHNHMLYHLTLVGAYSPLMMADYYEMLEGLGDMNDSQKVLVADKNAAEALGPLIDFLNVKYVLTDYPIETKKYQKVLEEKGRFLYQNPDFLQRAYFVSRSQLANRKQFYRAAQSPGFSPSRRVYLMDARPPDDISQNPELFFPVRLSESADQQQLSLRFEAPSSGYVVLSDIFYPGWNVSINGVSAEILRANGIFRAVKIEKPGSYTIHFDYQPVWKKLAWVTLILSLVCLAGPLLAGAFHARKAEAQGA